MNFLNFLPFLSQIGSSLGTGVYKTNSSKSPKHFANKRAKNRIKNKMARESRRANR